MPLSNYLLTGGNGFLGGIIRDVLTKQGLNITSVSRTGATGIQADISSPFTLPANTMADVVVHAAGKAHMIPRNKKEEKLFYDINYQGTINLCHAIEALPVKPAAFIFISTVAVYGVNTGENISEFSETKESTAYALSKRLAEKFLTEWTESFQIPLIILRLPLLVGPGAPGNLGVMVSAIRKGSYFRIGNGNARKSMVLASDIAAFIPGIVGKRGIYNLTDGYHPTFKELEEAICIKYKRKYPRVIPSWLIKAVAFAAGWIPDFPVNIALCEKILSPLTFNDDLARIQLSWHPRRVIENLEL